jgi:beta-lactamase class D
MLESCDKKQLTRFLRRAKTFQLWRLLRVKKHNLGWVVGWVSPLRDGHNFPCHMRAAP